MIYNISSHKEEVLIMLLNERKMGWALILKVLVNAFTPVPPWKILIHEQQLMVLKPQGCFSLRNGTSCDYFDKCSTTVFTISCHFEIHEEIHSCNEINVPAFMVKTSKCLTLWCVLWTICYFNREALEKHISSVEVSRFQNSMRFTLIVYYIRTYDGRIYEAI